MDLTEADLAAIQDRCGVREMTPLDGYESAIYRSTDPTGLIVRITHSSRRSFDQIAAEAEFLRELAAADVGVAGPATNTPVFSHETQHSGDVTCLVTHLAPGKGRSAADWRPQAIAAYGRIVGRMHAVAREMALQPPLARPRWNDPVMLNVDHDIGALDPEIVARSAEMVKLLASLTATAPHHLIHQDAHLGNLFITDDDEITLFDFDDSAYGPADYDLAMVVFYWTAGRRIDDVPAETRRLLDSFLPAYEAENPAHTVVPEAIDGFLTYRELDIYAATVGQGMDDSWATAFLEGRKPRIDSRLPYVGVPFAEL
jgi:Ser/Thr protein kinase RdoA (MazF antagonist)